MAEQLSSFEQSKAAAEAALPVPNFAAMEAALKKVALTLADPDAADDVLSKADVDADDLLSVLLPKVCVVFVSVCGVCGGSECAFTTGRVHCASQSNRTCDCQQMLIYNSSRSRGAAEGDPHMGAALLWL